MKKIFILLFILTCVAVFAQRDTTGVNFILPAHPVLKKPPFPGGARADKDNTAFFSLISAIRAGDAEGVKTVLDSVANVNLEYIDDDNGIITPLILAVSKNNPAIVQMLLDKGADVNFFALTGDYSLSWSPRCKNDDCVEIFKMLIAAKADPYYKDYTGLSLADYAYIAGNKRMIKEFEKLDIPHALDARELAGEIFLIDVGAGDFKKVKKYLASGGDVNYKGQTLSGQEIVTISALQTAVYGGNYEMVKLLVDGGADVNEGISNCAESEADFAPLNVAQSGAEGKGPSAEEYKKIFNLLTSAPSFNKEIFENQNACENDGGGEE